MAGGDRNTRSSVAPTNEPDAEPTRTVRPSAAAHRTERLMCLVFMIKARGRRGITRAELRGLVDDYARCASDEAYERMLERDKRDLRDVGVVLEVVQRDSWHEDEHAYVLGSDALLTLPALDAEELRLLSLAAEAWDKGTWQAMARGALHKLEVFGAEFLTDPAPRVTVRADAYLEPLRAAIRARHAVTFDYRRPGDTVPMQRRVEPWGLLSRNGGWYCIGFDLDRSAVRSFRTSRIAGSVQPAGRATQAPDPAWPTLLGTEPDAARTTSATLLVAPGRGQVWRVRGTVVGTRALGGVTHDVLEVSIPEDVHEVGALAAAAPAVLVLAPDELRERVLAHLGEATRD